MIIFVSGGVLPYTSEKTYKAAQDFLLRPTVLVLVREYYGAKKLKGKNVRPTKLVDFEGIAKHHNVNIMLYEPKTYIG